MAVSVHEESCCLFWESNIPADLAQERTAFIEERQIVAISNYGTRTIMQQL